MKKTKILSLAIFLTLLIGITGATLGYQEYFYMWKDNGNGGSHNSCHGTDNNRESTIGSLVLSVNVTGNLSPLQHFTLEVDILNFTEANEAQYEGRVTVGVPGHQGDNALFTSSLGSQTLNRRESVNIYGSYNPSNNNNKFDLVAPSGAGTYTLVALAIAGMNQTDASAYNLTYVQDSIQITVVGPTPSGPDTIFGANLAVIIGSILAVSTGTFFMIRKRMKRTGL
ncbi:MAG: hypothetical protein KGD70_11910 [Candidatus Lokiarchaeota archaeon]|nr:hypothetical protein [Candidatus Lokiarchaeota archaeon]